MLTRIISSVVAIVIAVVILMLHKTVVLPIAVALLTVGILYELFKAQKCLEYKSTAVICAVFGLSFPFFNYSVISEYTKQFILICAMLVFITFLLQYQKLLFEKLCFMITVTFLVTLSMNSLLWTKALNATHGLFFMVLALCGAWLADSGAYFAGTFLGKHKLCPSISPKKTVEGLIGGTLTNALIFVVITLVYSKFISSTTVEFNYPLMALLGMLCSLLGLLGDLTASLIKRQCQIKDYGNIMPGHGGVLDRFDSVLFVAPFIYFILSTVSVIQ